jgi:hypothetical protein
MIPGPQAAQDWQCHAQLFALFIGKAVDHVREPFLSPLPLGMDDVTPRLRCGQQSLPGIVGIALAFDEATLFESCNDPGQR